ncbi:hypothetical protein MLD38_024607 [Melastoma candidum]|uniref:Uncharacterized protein n=1 Tax=Melastoma candidum TaxID=119954 RepID=A0ACB9NZL3_9MYRT|nr:hypothetical protein MLD38_024607 [Melastoma candidum]
MLGGEPSVRVAATGRGDQAGRGQKMSSRWPREEALALIRVRSEMDVAFRDSSAKGPLWEEVSRWGFLSPIRNNSHPFWIRGLIVITMIKGKHPRLVVSLVDDVKDKSNHFLVVTIIGTHTNRRDS